ncbi:MAG TPA: 7-cyano-7-deazaguanine synthase QueC, partial [Fimbriimonas sp.]|nr:7-cyano-7-deazaguanine synthase QueC [Fimbriimonas sp.]
SKIPRAVVLLSGGLDSATALALARTAGFECYTMAFDYGQRHRVELSLAARQSSLQGAAKHIVVNIDLRQFGGSALTADIDVPKGRDEATMTEEIPITYVPARNTIFLSYGLAWAEVLDADAIFIGVNALDYSGYPDCRPEFIEAFQTLAQLATKRGVGGSSVVISTPLLHLTKAEIIQAGLGVGVDYSQTSSCYDPRDDGKPCGSCDSCVLRTRGFEQLGMTDPLLTRTWL